MSRTGKSKTNAAKCLVAKEATTLCVLMFTRPENAGGRAPKGGWYPKARAFHDVGRFARKRSPHPTIAKPPSPDAEDGPTHSFIPHRGGAQNHPDVCLYLNQGERATKITRSLPEHAHNVMPHSRECRVNTIQRQNTSSYAHVPISAPDKWVAPVAWPPD